jgi:hypothetical protein
VPERLSPLQTIAAICTKLDQGVSEEKIRESLDLEDDLFSFCVEFALENNFVIKQGDGTYTITLSGKAFVSAFRSSVY